MQINFHPRILECHFLHETLRCATSASAQIVHDAPTEECLERGKCHSTVITLSLSSFVSSHQSISTFPTNGRFNSGNLSDNFRQLNEVTEEGVPNAKRKRTEITTKCAKLNTLVCTTTKSSVVQMYRKKAKKRDTHFEKVEEREGLNQH